MIHGLLEFVRSCGCLGSSLPKLQAGHGHTTSSTASPTSVLCNSGFPRVGKQPPGPQEHPWDWSHDQPWGHGAHGCGYSNTPNPSAPLTPQGTTKKPSPVLGYTSLQVFREHGDVVLRDIVSEQYWQMDGWTR